MSWTPSKTGIQPVDKALNKLKYHLNQLQGSQETTEQDVDDLQTKAGLVDDVFLKAFDSGVDGWNVREGSGTTALPSNGSVGGKVLEVDGYYWVAYPDNIIFHPNRLYRMRVRARMTQFARNRYLSLPGESGDYASTPDSAALDITGDIDVRVAVALDDWTPDAFTYLLDKLSSTGGYLLRLNSSNDFEFFWRNSDGVNRSTVATDPLPVADGEMILLRAALDVDDGAGGHGTTFYTKTSTPTQAHADLVDNAGWTQLGDTVSAHSQVANVGPNVDPLALGAEVGGTNRLWSGRYYAAAVLDGIDGTVAFNADFTDQPVGATSFTEESSNAATVTVNQSGDPQAEIVRSTTPEERLYVGVEGVASDGETLVNVNGADSYGSQHYVGASDDLGDYTLGEWQEYLAYFQGRSATPSGSPSGDPRQPSRLHNSVRYFRPVMVLNYDGGDGVMEIDAVAVEIVTESAEIDALGTTNAPAEAGAEKTAGHSLWELDDREPAAVGAEPGIHAGTNPPSNTDKLWLDTTGGEPYIWHRHDGSAWVRATSESGDINALDTVNAPAESGAEVTEGKDLSVLVGRYLDRLNRAAGNSTTLAEILAKIDDVGDLLQGALYDDGLGKRTFVVGRQANEHADGDAVLFEEPFQNTPTIIFAPGGRIQLPSGGAAGPDPVWGNLFGLHVASQSGGSGDTVIYDYVRAEDLSASGFTLVAKLIERDITVTAEEELFPDTASDLLETEGDTTALGGLTDEAGDSQYTALYDYDLSITSTGSITNETQNFPGGTISTVGGSISESLDNEANDNVYETTFGWSLDVTSSGSTTSENFASGSIDDVDESKSVSLSDVAVDNNYTAHYDISLPGDGGSSSISIVLESFASGDASWTEHDSATHISGLQPINTSFSMDATRALASGDDFRIRVTSVSGSPSVDPTTIEYSVADTYKVDVTVAVDHDGVQQSTKVVSSTDSDGTGNLESGSETESNTDSGLSQGDNITVRIADISETGDGSYTLSVDPDKVEYTTGSADTATLAIEVAIDSKDGANAWVERVVNTHQVTDNSATGENKTGSDGGTFTYSAIGTGDDVRVRLKSVDVTGSPDSSSVEVDPDKVAYNTHSGTETEHSKTPTAGDTIRWDAVAG